MLTFSGRQFEGIWGGEGLGPVMTSDRRLIGRFLSVLKERKVEAYTSLPQFHPFSLLTIHFRPGRGNRGESTPKPLYVVFRVGDHGHDHGLVALGPGFIQVLHALAAHTARQVNKEVRARRTKVVSVRFNSMSPQLFPRVVKEPKELATLLHALTTLNRRTYSWDEFSRPVYVTLLLRNGEQKVFRFRLPVYDEGQPVKVPEGLWKYYRPLKEGKPENVSQP